MSGKLIGDFVSPMTDEVQGELTDDEVIVPVDADAGTVAAFMGGRKFLLVAGVDLKDIIGVVWRKDLPEPSEWIGPLLRAAPKSQCRCACGCTHVQFLSTEPGDPPYKCEGCGHKSSYPI
jgi:hypothetical protein